MPRDAVRVDNPHEVSGGAEHGSLEREGESDRHAELQHLRQPLPVGAPPMAEQMEAAELPVRDNDDEEGERDQRPYDCARQSAAEDAELRESEMTEDQAPPQKGIRRHSDRRDDQDPLRPLQGRDEVAHRLEQ